jgi:hypothetical protein
MKSVKFEFEGSKLVVVVDPNQDGQALLKLEIELAEIPDEVLAALAAKKVQA